MVRVYRNVWKQQGYLCCSWKKKKAPRKWSGVACPCQGLHFVQFRLTCWWVLEVDRTKEFADSDRGWTFSTKLRIEGCKTLLVFFLHMFILLGVYTRKQYFLLSSQLLLHCDVHFSAKFFFPPVELSSEIGDFLNVRERRRWFLFYSWSNKGEREPFRPGCSCSRVNMADEWRGQVCVTRSVPVSLL